MKFIYLLGICVSSYLIYRYNKKKNTLLLIHSNSKLAKFFKMITDIFLENYTPSIFFSSGHVQTVLLEIINLIVKNFKQFLNFFKFNYKNQIFTLSDGGSLIISKARIDVKYQNKNKNSGYNSRIYFRFR